MLDIPTATTYPSTRPALRVVRDEESPPYDAAFEPPPAVEKPAGGFAMIPRAVLDLHDGNLIGMYAVLAGFANEKRECWPSIGALCEATGWSDRYVRNLIAKLADAGILAIERRFKDGMRSSHLYRIIEKSPDNQIGTSYHTFGTQCRSDRYTVPVGSVPHTDKQEPVELEPSELTPPTEAKPPKSPTPKKAERRIPMPPDFDLSPERMAYALAHGMTELDAERMFEQMRVWSKSDGGKYIDWNAAWQKWVLRREEQRGEAKPVHRNGNGYHGGQQTVAEKMAEAVAMIERKRAGSTGDVIDVPFRTGEGR